MGIRTPKSELNGIFIIASVKEPCGNLKKGGVCGYTEVYSLDY